MSMYSKILTYTYQTTRQTLHTVVNKFEIPAGRRLLSNGCSSALPGRAGGEAGRWAGCRVVLRPLRPVS